MIMGFTKPIEHSNLITKEGDLMNPLYVGIDVSSKSNVIYLMLPNGDKHSNFSVANSHEGSTQLVKRILSAMTSCSLDAVLIGPGAGIDDETSKLFNVLVTKIV